MSFELELEPIESASFSASRDTIGNSARIGPEKRINARRSNPERREMIRYDTLKADRRGGEDRRGSTQNWKYSL